MRTFKGIGSGKCVICKTSNKGEVILVPIEGTEDDGICEAQPIHVDCINLSFNRDHGLLYQRIKESDDQTTKQEEVGC